MQLNYVWGIMYDMNLNLIKISLLLLYIRIFPVRWFTITSWTLIVFLIAFTVTLLGKDIFACVPVRKVWEPLIPGHCINSVITYYWASAVFIVTDLLVLLLPQPLVWHLQIAKWRKVGLSVLFCLGSW